MGILIDTNTVFILRWKSIVGASVMVGVVLAVYGIIYLLRETSPNPIWMFWWVLCGSYSAAFGEVVYRRYAAHKENQLTKALANPSGMTWEIYTSDNAKIGEIAESDYLKVKHEADLCLSTKLLQGLNYLWIVWNVTARMLFALPSLLLLLFIGTALTMPNEELAHLTIGQLMTFISLPVLGNLFFMALLLTFVAYAITGKLAPGYKNYYGLRLKRLLSRHVPNIANANGYRIDGYTITHPEIEAGSSK